MKDKKPKLTQEQNLALQGLNLQQKLEQLYKWFKRKEISKEAFEYFSNAWINKQSKKEKDLLALRSTPKENFVRMGPRAIVEGEIQAFLEKLRGNVRAYITNRNATVSNLTTSELEKFKNYVRKYCTIYPDKISRLLIVGLRYPDSTKQINKFCMEWIRSESLAYGKNYFFDKHFWGLLWEDGDLVPLDAIRLMGTKKDDTFFIDERFEKTFIKTLMPYFEAQRDKEVMRLKVAQMRDDRDHDTQVARKLKRLNAFNILISAAEKYCAAEAELAAE